MSSVTASEKLTKQPGESRLYDFDFTNLLGDNTINSAIAAEVEAAAFGNVPGASALGTGTPTISSPLVQVRLSGGTDGEDYRVQVTCTDSVGNVLQLDGILKVRDS